MFIATVEAENAGLSLMTVGGFGTNKIHYCAGWREKRAGIVFKGGQGI
ncbi:MAG: hypothetical protein JWM59_2277 [Verrucomicrobiales bacterium]|nr:hypothetical protein [Verrucomicrobiales bacterium]